MKNIILLVVLFFCIPSQASVVGSLFKAIKKGADEVPTSAKKADSETINGKKEDAVPKDIDKDLADDLAFIESPNFRFSPDDLLKGGDDLDNAFSLIPPSQEFINFSNWLKIQMVATPLRTTVQDFIDQSNKELIDSDSNGAVTDSNDDSLTIDQLHELISQELKDTSDNVSYSTNTAIYFNRLTAYGWGEFSPLRDYDWSKQDELPLYIAIALEASRLSLTSKAGFDVGDLEEWVRQNVLMMSSSSNGNDIAKYLIGCRALPNDSPDALGKMTSVAKKLFEGFCTTEQLLNVPTKIAAMSGDPAMIALVETSLLPMLALNNAMPDYYRIRDKMLSKVPELIELQEFQRLDEILTLIAFSEVQVGNLKNSYDIGSLLLLLFGTHPEIKNKVLGNLLPTIFIEAKDIAMTAKLLRLVELMADSQSDFFVLGISKINLLTVMINYARLRKEQSI